MFPLSLKEDGWKLWWVCQKVDLFVQPHPKQVQLLIKTKLQGKFQLTPSQVIDFEKHTKSPFDLAYFRQSSLNFPIDVKPTSTKKNFILILTT
jgi:hypothetical protein